MSQPCMIPLSVYISHDEDEFQLCHFLFSYIFLREEWLRLHDIAQSDGQQWHPWMNNPQEFNSLCSQSEGCKYF